MGLEPTTLGSEAKQFVKKLKASKKASTDLIYFDDKIDEQPVMERLAEELKKGISLTSTDNVSVKVGSETKKM